MHNTMKTQNLHRLPQNQKSNHHHHQRRKCYGATNMVLFHTLAEKVKEIYFQEIKYDLFSFIRRICNNLPCPDCAKHATQYMKTVILMQSLQKSNSNVCCSIFTMMSVVAKETQYYHIMNSMKNTMRQLHSTS